MIPADFLMDVELHQDLPDPKIAEVKPENAVENFCKCAAQAKSDNRQEELCMCIDGRFNEFHVTDSAAEGRVHTHASHFSNKECDSRTFTTGLQHSLSESVVNEHGVGMDLHQHHGMAKQNTDPVHSPSLATFCFTSSVITSIESLPLEILLKIFSFLHPVDLCRHVAPVCRRWRILAIDHSLWHKLDLSSASLHVTGIDICMIVLRVGRSIHLLNLHGVDVITPVQLMVIAENCPELMHLDMGFVSTVNPVVIHSILVSCQRLESLNVEGCKDVHHEFAQAITRVSCPALCRLNFSHCPLVDDSLLLLSASLSRIVALNIDGISWISNRTVRDLVDTHKNSLENLEVDGAELTDEAMTAVASCKHLSSLSVSFCEQLSDLSLLDLKKLPSLRKLCLRKGTMFSALGLTEFLSSPSLASLSYLDLSECASLNDDGVQALAKCCGGRLRTLALSWCWDVTDVGLIAILDGCSSLVSLNLIGVHRLTGSCLDRVPEDMPCLRHLDLQQCNLIEDAFVADLVRRKPDLVVFNYYGEIFVHCPGD